MTRPHLDVVQSFEAVVGPPGDVIERQSFFLQASRILSQIVFLEAPVEELLHAFDELLVVRTQIQAFKLPRWLTDLFVQLADVRENDEVLDLFSNFGDVAAAIAKSNGRANVVSVVNHRLTYLWAAIQQRILMANERNEIVFGQMPPIGIQPASGTPRPSKIIVAPPFNLRLPTVFGRTELSEDVYLSLALEQVAPGGRIVAIVPESFLFSKKPERRQLRSSMLSKMSVRAIVSLDTFMPNTSIKTSVLVLDKVPANKVDRVLLGRVQRSDIPSHVQSTLSCREIPRIAGLLEAFRSKDYSRFRAGEMWTIATQDLTADNFAITQYSNFGDAQPLSTYPVIPLADVADVFKGSALTLDEEGDLLVIGPGAVRKLSIDPTKLDRTRHSRLTSHPIVAQADDIVINALGKYRGEAALVEPELAGYFISRNIIVVRLQRNMLFQPSLLPAFLAIALNSKFVTGQLANRTTGSVIEQITKGAMLEVLVPVPELNVQRQIIEETTKIRQDILVAEQMLAEHQNMLDQAQETLGAILEHLHTDGGVR